MTLIRILLIFSLNLVFIWGQDAPIVTIPDGSLLGIVNQTVGSNTTYYGFRGIPYAESPVGNLRFASPVASAAWTGTYNATVDRDPCTQNGGLLGSEDCLHLNVYSTNLTASLPVMVWIHGGTFVRGSSIYKNFAPDYLIEKGVVVVLLNYRLGVFGWLSTDDSSAYGNWGLKDQILALQWVQTNIAYFGGDSTKVTIFGQSAGSASISYLVQSSLTTGLFRGAIMNSGTSFNLWSLARNAGRKAFSLGTTLGIVALTSDSLITQLRTVDYKKLSAAEDNVTTAAYLSDGFLAGLHFGIVKEVAHSGAVFSGNSYDLLSNGEFQTVPLIIGYDSNEFGNWTSYIESVRPILVEYDALNSRLAPYDISTDEVKKLGAGTEIENRYFKLTMVASDSGNITHFASVDQFNRPIRKAVGITSAFTSVYYYRFAYKGEQIGDTNVAYQGVSHEYELNFLFANRGNASVEDSLIRDQYVTLYTNFAKFRNPTPPVTNTVLGNLTWEPNTASDNTTKSIKFLNINTTIAMDTNPDQEDWQFYQDIYTQYGDVSAYATY